MAVTLTALDFAIALRVSDGAAPLESPIDSLMGRLLTASTALVEDYAGAAPEAIQNEATIRLGGFLYDAAPSRQFQNPMDNSGARALLAPFRVRRAIPLVGVTGAVADVSALDMAAINAAIDAAVAAHRDISAAHHTPGVPGNGNGVATEQTIRYGYSVDAVIDIADFTETATGTEITLENAPESGHLLLWRSDADGGDFTLVDIARAGNQRAAFSAAEDLTLDGIPGKAIISNRGDLSLAALAAYGIFLDGPEPSGNGDDPSEAIATLTAEFAAHMAAAAAHHAVPGLMFNVSEPAADGTVTVSFTYGTQQSGSLGKFARSNPAEWARQGNDDRMPYAKSAEEVEAHLTNHPAGFGPVELLNASFNFSSVGFVQVLTTETTWRDYEWLILDFGETSLSGSNDVYPAFWTRRDKIEGLDRVLTGAISQTGQGEFARFGLPNGQEFLLGRTGLFGLAGATTAGVDIDPLRIYGI